MVKKKREYHDYEYPYWEEQLEKVEKMKDWLNADPVPRNRLLLTHRRKEGELKLLLTPALRTYISAKEVIEKCYRPVLTEHGVGYEIIDEGLKELYFGTSSYPAPSVEGLSCEEITLAEYMRKVMGATCPQPVSDD